MKRRQRCFVVSVSRIYLAIISLLQTAPLINADLCLKLARSTQSKKKTALMFAAGNGKGEVVKLLLEKGAKLESSNDVGWTPLLYAASEGHEAVVELLLERGANVEAKDRTVRLPPRSACPRPPRVVVIVMTTP